MKINAVINEFVVHKSKQERKRIELKRKFIWNEQHVEKIIKILLKDQLHKARSTAVWTLGRWEIMLAAIPALVQTLAEGKSIARGLHIVHTLVMRTVLCELVKAFICIEKLIMEKITPPQD